MAPPSEEDVVGRFARVWILAVVAATASACGLHTPGAPEVAPELVTPAEHARAAAASVDDARLRDAASEPGSWLSHGRDPFESRYSPLAQIDEHDVGELGLAWWFDTQTSRGLEATPLVVDGVIYTTGSWSVVFAIDARKGDLSGRDAVIADYQRFFANARDLLYSQPSAAVEPHGDHVIVRAPFEITYKDASDRVIEVRGTAAWTLVRRDGTTLIRNLDFEITPVAAGR